MDKNNKPKEPNQGYAIPFFLALAILTVVAFIIPLRPTQSQAEKRALAEFPEFSVEALVSGSYFDDITTWFSDTFPGRESWLSLSADVEALHGKNDIVIHGDLPPVEEPAPTETEPTETEPTEPIPTETIVLQETTPPTIPVEEWGGVDAGQAEITFGSVLQINDAAYNYFRQSEYVSDKYIAMVNSLVEALEGSGVTVISAPAPTAIGIMVESEYMEMLNCVPQDQVLEYLHSRMDERVVTVDTYNALVPHNDEYLFFRTDHHWAALGAYYTYVAVCEALGYEAASLDNFEVWDQGEFVGSLYYQCNQSDKLRKDNVYAYMPYDDITTKIYNEDGYGFEWPLLTDMSKSPVNSKYMTFLAGDHPMVVITNNDKPDAPNCVIIKDSFGNCFAPFLSQNYHNVYVLDYRMYYQMTMSRFVEEYDITDLILLPAISSTQSESVVNLYAKLCK